ncbi:hypothetical protein EU244_030765 [Rhodococcus qingshengii]|uniref:hypothetical protein n=1 Tax=Rhodococcus qingshengii TaxID=334542 RepID=UPI0010A5BF07|nr:hypothetical protein [Rhodococcus qingshengii]THJ65716.1 hypothetical protein EU244_28950 [Rhodococcus qingshengii]
MRSGTNRSEYVVHIERTTFNFAETVDRTNGTLGMRYIENRMHRSASCAFTGCAVERQRFRTTRKRRHRNTP